MRLWQRTILILAIDVVAFLAIVTVGEASAWPEVVIIASIVALHLIGANLAHRYFVRCPHCGEWAGRTPSHWYTIWPGAHCRYCDCEY